MNSFFPILALIFIILKLIGTISWSWWLVLLLAVIMLLVEDVSVEYFRK